MKNKIFIIRNLVIAVNIIIYFYVTFFGNNQYIYDMTYLKSVLFMIINAIFIYVSGITLDEEKIYKQNISLYIMLFLVLLFSVTFIIGRPSFRIYTWTYGGLYTPFKTIISQFKYGTNLSILKNILGNIFMLVPFSFLLIMKNEKNTSFLRQTLITLPIILIIEITQAITHTGTFDIDDIILNYIGIIIFTLIGNFISVTKIKKLFISDFNLKESLKYLMFTCLLIILIIFDISLFI